jgi:methyl-accepting chemotaxis protein
MLGTDGYDSPLSAASFMARAQSEYDEAQKVIASLAEDIEQSAANGGKRLATFADLVVKVLAGVAIAALAIVMPVTLLNVKSVVDPLREAETLAERIGAGDLSEAKIDLRGKDEPARLLNALDAMRQSLTGIVSTIRNSTESIHNASSEITIGNQDLSVRTEQAAASLQQAASSMEQLTATVRGSADSAKEANKLAGRAADIAQQGGQVMTAVVDTMERIKGSSRKISDIISVIDGIAFQTNILALNAAVEAARAGNAGRGFSVVASEVRALAQRSAQAAREIKDLIEESVNHVREGTEKVSVAGVTMQEIVGAVERVSAIVNEIRTSADEQSDTIGAVNDSVSQLDRMTQQNAALVEESAAAAESLKDQASMLADSVDIFKLAPDGGCNREKESMAHAHKDSRYEAQPQQLFTAGRELAYPA